MTRRHLLALVILALVVARMLAMGPVRVWHWLTTKTVEEHYDDGTLHWRCKGYWWSTSGRNTRTGLIQAWTPDGRLKTNIRVVRGRRVSGICSSGVPVAVQLRYVNRKSVEVRKAPPWFTEEEILQSVEGVEE